MSAGQLTDAAQTLPQWTCLPATWAVSRSAYAASRPGARDAFERNGWRTDGADDAADASDASDRALRLACASVGRTMAKMNGEASARALAVRRATRKVLREFGEVEDANAALDDLSAALKECAEKTVLPRRADGILRTLHAIARSGKAIDIAIAPEYERVMPTCGGVMDTERATQTARYNANVAAAYYEALSCVLGAESVEALGYFRRLGAVDGFNDDKLLVLGVIETFLGLIDAPKERGDATAACVHASGALKMFISRGFNAMAEKDRDRSMVKRFMTFVLTCLRCDNASFGRIAFEGIEASEVAVVLQLCLSWTADEPTAPELYQEIKRRMSK